MEKFGCFIKTVYFCSAFNTRAFSSAGLEHLPYKQRVGGSNPSTPTGVIPRGPSGLRGYFFGWQIITIEKDFLFALQSLDKYLAFRNDESHFPLLIKYSLLFSYQKKSCISE